MCKKARVASLLIAGATEGLTRFHAERTSVSGTSRESYRGCRDSTVEPQVSLDGRDHYAPEKGSLTSSLATRVAIGAIDFLVFGLVGGLHIPLKAVLEAQAIILIFYPFELFGAVAQCSCGMNKV
jgi:hypothetical protein